ncbi:MAG: FAD-dependent oxidoreductase, partial [Gammaproteobacteria bacterium]
MTHATYDLLIAGSGFAGTWAALAAARARAAAGRERDLAITMVSPAPCLPIRPRFYETAFEEMAPDITPLLAAVGVDHRAASIERVDTAAQTVDLVDSGGTHATLGYGRLVLATGSTVSRPALPGLATYAFDVDQLESARALDRHLRALAQAPTTPARDTVVVVGGGFTGIETAAELPGRLRSYLGEDVAVRVVVVEQAAAIGPDLGPGPRPVIESALAASGVELRTGAAVTALDADGVMLADGSRIAAATVVWTTGARASALAAGIPGEHDAWGRVVVDRNLRAPLCPQVFLAGDTAHAATDDAGNVALMSCQHALSLGRVAGYNAAADLLGLPLHPYSQAKYVTCLDLGPWGAVYTEGWQREVVMAGAEAKALKRSINTEWIYPPPADREAAFALAA